MSAGRDGGEDDEPKPYDGPCQVCGETVLGREYLAIGLGGIFTVEGDGIGWTPDHSPRHYDEWEDISQTLCIHRECVDNFFDGAVAQSAHARRKCE